MERRILLVALENWTRTDAQLATQDLLLPSMAPKKYACVLLLVLVKMVMQGLDVHMKVRGNAHLATQALS